MGDRHTHFLQIRGVQVIWRRKICHVMNWRTGRFLLGAQFDEVTPDGREVTSLVTTLHYTSLQYTTRHYSTLHVATLHYTSLKYTTRHFSTLPVTTVHYTSLQYTTRHYSTLHVSTGDEPRDTPGGRHQGGAAGQEQEQA